MFKTQTAINDQAAFISSFYYMHIVAKSFKDIWDFNFQGALRIKVNVKDLLLVSL